MFSFGWFSSGRDQAAIDLFTAVMDRMATGFIPGRLAYVFCDRAPGETEASDRFRASVKARGVPLLTQSSGELRDHIKARVPELPALRDAFDAQVIERVQDYAADVAVLAGYMLIISPRLCRAFLCLNLHPAVPGGPKGTWQQVMWQIMEAGHKEAGGMMHLATPELDEGPPVTYFRLPLTGPEFEPLYPIYRKAPPAEPGRHPGPGGGSGTTVRQNPPRGIAPGVPPDPADPQKSGRGPLDA
jgi:phosphoribosylglycinamide formyltransferase-1